MTRDSRPRFLSYLQREKKRKRIGSWNDVTYLWAEKNDINLKILTEQRAQLVKVTTNKANNIIRESIASYTADGI